MNAVSLYELNEYIQRVLALNFQETIWLKCEISQLSTVRGQVYLELVEKEEGKDIIKAQASAIIWYKSYLFIKNKLKDLSDHILQEGSDVLVKVKVTFHERYGLKLSIEDIDPSYTIGQAAIQRMEIIEQLKKEKLIHKNAETSLSSVIQKIAVISSERAAGFQDFFQQLQNNAAGYNFEIYLHESSMQGALVEKGVIAALDEIQSEISTYDCVVIIRGGGAKLDLAGFDNYKIAKKIAQFPIPVLTGIGHEIDQTIIDLVSYLELKTPTAVANFILDHNLNFESELHHLGRQIKELVSFKVQRERKTIDQFSEWIKYLPSQKIQKEKVNLENLILNLREKAKLKIQNNQNVLSNLQEKIDILHPDSILRRGFSFTMINGKIISEKDQVELNDTITSHLKDGILTSTITSKS